MRNFTLITAAVAAAVFSVAMFCSRPAEASDFLYTNTPDGGCLVVGDDGGTTAKLAVTSNTQFMVTTSAQVNYRSCTSSTCTAGPTDAPIASGAQVDLCQKQLYSYVSFFAPFDGGTTTVCVYGVNPKTICQINSP